MNLQQSTTYQEYIKKLGWQVIEVDGQVIFLKHIPLFGNLAKLQRPQKLPQLAQLIKFVKSYKIRRLAIEPEYNEPQTELTRLIEGLNPHVQLNRSPFLPTKTIMIDLTSTEEEIFHKFSEAKRRAVRRAVKNNLYIQESNNIGDLIKIKNKSAGFLGFITTTGTRQLWETFTEKNTTTLLAYEKDNHKLIGGIMLLFHDATAYYWIAGATREGKKLFAPTLLAWEALKLSKKRGMKQFDFVGVWDERLPQENKQWLGFTRFKEGFGGESFFYPLGKA